MTAVDSGWTFGSVWEAVADRMPTAPALRHGGTTTSWKEFEQNASNLGGVLLDAGLGHQAKVAQHLFNGPEYMESLFAAFKVGMVPVNTNYRYTADELAYLWDNADVEAVVFHAELADRCDAVRRMGSRVRLWIWVGSDTEECPSWAVPYTAAVTSGLAGRPPWATSGDDLLLLYTGGTTGRPKGVMWSQDSVFRMLEELNGRPVGPIADPGAYADAIDRRGPIVLPAPPLMHATALWFAMPALNRGGCVVTLPSRAFDASELLDTLVGDHVSGLCIVGDAFARSIVDALDATPGRWNLDRLRVIFSSGVRFSDAMKARLRAEAPRATIVDGLGSSESGSLGRSVSKAGEQADDQPFELGESTKVIGEDGRPIVPGSGTPGRLAISGHLPLGYYNDPVNTAETFVVLDGVRHVVVGDWVELESDGSVRFLGRGSECINTGGEKVYVEEVEDAIRRFRGVRDAVVVGLPHERFGEAVGAVIEPVDPDDVDVDGLLGFLRTELAPYKVPRTTLVAPVDRAPNGKADYRRIRDLLIESTAGNAA